jgi:hypothetical protein
VIKADLLLFGVGALLLLVIVKYSRDIGKKAGETAAGTVGDFAAGVVVGIGKQFGIPDTDAAKCARALAEGRTWDASFACPASDFIKGTFGSDRPLDTIGATGSW